MSTMEELGLEILLPSYSLTKAQKEYYILENMLEFDHKYVKPSTKRIKSYLRQ